MITENQRTDVVAQARTWLGTPWHHMGDVQGAGVDCLMLLVRVYSACKLIPADVDPRPYAQDWHMHRAEEMYLAGVGQYSQATDTPLPGDVAMFQFGRCVAHAAIVVEWPLIIHAFRDQRAVVLSDVSVSDYLSRRLRGFFTVMGAH